MNKRGQITIIIIVGIVMLVIFGIMFYLRGYMTGLKSETSVQLAPSTFFDAGSIRSYMEGSLTAYATEAIKELGEQGGYLNLGDVDDVLGAPYFLPYKSFILPLNGAGSIASEISELTEEKFKQRTDLSQFYVLGYNITELSAYPAINTVINAEDVTVSLDYPLEIVKRRSTASLNNFRVRIPIRLNESYDLMRKMVDDIDNDVEYDFAAHCYEYEDNHRSIYTDNQGENDYIVEFWDSKYPLVQYPNRAFIFRFALKERVMTGECGGGVS